MGDTYSNVRASSTNAGVFSLHLFGFRARASSTNADVFNLHPLLLMGRGPRGGQAGAVACRRVLFGPKVAGGRSPAPHRKQAGRPHIKSV